mgnify:CR=1 FL=1
MSKKKVVGLGAGGHAKVIIDILSMSEGLEVIGLTNADPATVGSLVLGVPILGNDKVLSGLRSAGVAAAFIGVGSIGDCRPRRRLFLHASELGFEMINAIHPTATVAQSARIGRGVALMAHAVVNPDVQIGDNVIVNTGAQIDHDCRISDHVHIAPGACLSGDVQVAECAHIGVGATIMQGIRIGQGALVGAGSVVLRDVAAYTTVFGIPARVIEKRMEP